MPTSCVISSRTHRPAPCSRTRRHRMRVKLLRHVLPTTLTTPTSLDCIAATRFFDAERDYDAWRSALCVFSASATYGRHRLVVDREGELREGDGGEDQ